jgi:16S rRNA (adenine1518-N6/adenine1519-N6)-dimethyltransferase
MKLSEMRRVLEERGIRLSRSLGQNFLHDGNQLRRIVEAAGLEREDLVLEIGPGLGPLTRCLVARGARVLAIEKDGRLVEVLREEMGAVPNLELVHADGLEYLRGERRGWGEWKMVSNLPYSVASALLVELALRVAGPKRMVVTLQWEVARRLVAEAGAGDYGILTLLVQVRYEVSEWFKIPAGCFFPVPEVDSACVRLDRRSEPLVADAGLETYERVVKRSFSQRRKMMLKLLRVDWPEKELERIFGELGLSRSVRAEMVTARDFAALTGRLGGVMGLGK